jgi:hypothetical protein
MLLFPLRSAWSEGRAGEKMAGTSCLVEARAQFAETDSPPHRSSLSLPDDRANETWVGGADHFFDLSSP